MYGMDTQLKFSFSGKHYKNQFYQCEAVQVLTFLLLSKYVQH